MYMWHAVDGEGEVLEILVQPRRDKAAAIRRLRKLLRRQGFVLTVIVTDKLRSYGAALRELGFSGCTSKDCFVSLLCLCVNVLRRLRYWEVRTLPLARYSFT
jgi:transposase-like protein